MSYGIMRCDKCGVEMYGDMTKEIATHICVPRKPAPQIPQTEAVFDRTASHCAGEYVETIAEFTDAVAATHCKATISTPLQSPADARQVGGTHYKAMRVQPWTVMEYLLTPQEFIGYLKGCAIKYSMRNGHKQDSDDAGKLEHYLQKLAEVQSQL